MNKNQSQDVRIKIIDNSKYFLRAHLIIAYENHSTVFVVGLKLLVAGRALWDFYKITQFNLYLSPLSRLSFSSGEILFTTLNLNGYYSEHYIFTPTRNGGTEKTNLLLS